MQSLRGRQRRHKARPAGRAAAPGGGSTAGESAAGGHRRPPGMGAGQPPGAKRKADGGRCARRRISPTQRPGRGNRSAAGTPGEEARATEQGARTGADGRPPSEGRGQAAGGQQRPAVRAGRAPVPQHWLHKKGSVWRTAYAVRQGETRPAYLRGLGGKPKRPATAIGRPTAVGVGRPEARQQAARLQTRLDSRGSCCRRHSGGGSPLDVGRGSRWLRGCRQLGAHPLGRRRKASGPGASGQQRTRRTARLQCACGVGRRQADRGGSPFHGCSMAHMEGLCPPPFWIPLDSRMEASLESKTPLLWIPEWEPEPPALDSRMESKDPGGRGCPT